MSFSAGDTFINKSATNLPSHLWAVISNTQPSVGKIVIVNFTSWRQGEDESCVLDKGDHPYIKHRTYISYRDAHVVSLAKLEELENRNLITRKETLEAIFWPEYAKGRWSRYLSNLKSAKSWKIKILYDSCGEIKGWVRRCAPPGRQHGRSTG